MNQPITTCGDTGHRPVGMAPAPREIMSKEEKRTTIPLPDGALSYRDDGVTKNAVYARVLAFCKKHNCYHGESFAQMDSPQEGVYELMDELFDAMEFTRIYSDEV